jgi:AcrR family transcriptional regulator
VSDSDPLRARKTPRQRRATHTVDALLEAAAQVLESEGLAGFNTNAVARRAGASIGSLYQYFPSKDALTLALLLDQQEERPEFQAARGDKIGFRVLVVEILQKPGAPAHREVAASDLMALIRGMTDAAGARGERDVADLAQRIGAAVFGYLNVSNLAADPAASQ